MSDLTKNIFDIKKSKSFIEYNQYHKGNILGIAKVSRWEMMHSNFIAWLLDPDSSHMLHTFPLQQLIMSLEFLKEKTDNRESRLDISIVRKFYEDSFAIGANVAREYNHVDIHILIQTQGKTLPLIIENKVDSKENGKNRDQTDCYYDWGEDTYSDKTEFYEPIYLFLLPEYNKNLIQKNKSYLRMTYQELVDYVIDPALFRCTDSEAKNNIRTYLQCLSYQEENEKGDTSMAVSSEERRILEDFINENRNLLCAVLNELKDDVDDDIIKTVTSSVRDRSRYIFDGEIYNKKDLVLAVVKKYVIEHPTVTLNELDVAFPKKLQGSSYGVFKIEDRVSDKEKGKDGAVKRYFVDCPINLSSGERVLVSTQWGIDNIERFIDNAKKQHGYVIEKQI